MKHALFAVAIVSLLSVDAYADDHREVHSTSKDLRKAVLRFIKLDPVVSYTIKKATVYQVNRESNINFKCNLEFDCKVTYTLKF